MRRAGIMMDPNPLGTPFQPKEAAELLRQGEFRDYLLCQTAILQNKNSAKK